MTMSKHEASAAALGYLFQTQWPLLDLLRRAKTEPDCTLSLELVDDVQWDKDGQPVELIQAKHHVSTAASLTDKSSDWWRTLAVWMDAGSASDIDGPRLILLTTSSAPAGSAAEALRVDNPDTQAALALLETAATTSTSESTSESRKRFLALEADERAAFVSRISVCDNSPTITDLDQAVRAELHWSIPVGHEDLFIGLVWDWWFRVAISLLTRDRTSIGALETQAALDGIRDSFGPTTLPTLVSREAFDPNTLGDFRGRTFVRQLDMVGVPPVILRASVQDYYRAYTQSALWIENNLVDIGEVSRFEADLRDEWERAFAWMVNSFPPNISEEKKKEAGRELLRRCTDTTHLQMRDNYKEAFFVRGKLQQLADQRQAGWHPDFEALLDSLMATATT